MHRGDPQDHDGLKIGKLPSFRREPELSQHPALGGSRRGGMPVLWNIEIRNSFSLKNNGIGLSYCRLC
jgi:hypothetical protein